jgi:hypothetical protein
MYNYTLYDKLSNPFVKHVRGIRFGSIRRETCMILLDNPPTPPPANCSKHSTNYSRHLATVSGNWQLLQALGKLLHAIGHLLHALSQLLHALGKLLHM